MRFRLLAAGTGLLAGLVLFAACGAALGPRTAVTPAPSAPSASGQVSDGDEGRTLTFHVGDTISVVLHQQQGFQAWGNLDSSDHGVLAPKVDPRRASAVGVTLGLFTAASAGKAQITASAGMACSPGVACAALARLWMVTVEVV